MFINNFLFNRTPWKEFDTITSDEKTASNTFREMRRYLFYKAQNFLKFLLSDRWNIITVIKIILFWVAPTSSVVWFIWIKHSCSKFRRIKSFSIAAKSFLRNLRCSKATPYNDSNALNELFNALNDGCFQLCLSIKYFIFLRYPIIFWKIS